MKITGNTILITGGGSGIGLELATAFKKSENQVIVAGRSLDKLDNAKSRGLITIQVDMTNERSIRAMVDELLTKFPALNTVIHNAGVMKNEKLLSHDTSAISHDTIATNLLGPIYLTNALLPHFKKQNSAAIITVTSGLAFVPLMMAPSYSASKAAIHSYTQSLRYQLRGTAIEVKELVPPYVRTALMGDRQKMDMNAMPLEDFISEVMSIFREQPTADEILVQRVLPQRTAGLDRTRYEEFFQKQNDTMLKARQAE